MPPEDTLRDERAEDAEPALGAGTPDVQVPHAWSTDTGEALRSTPAPGGNRVLVADPVASVVVSGGGSGEVLLLDVRTGVATSAGRR